ncbi:bile acid-CoA:amino acid N-acyltransferase-like [Megalops cyprinoides]|uniref:bile acid-CoA:amino acid N-acyltransferase-like n=1 Tax=Megalops cyprinoides TaxID=118141 RepID=UPI001864570C|nr:bile acid-CoA:amino acid N-acyltransferase-like [Megalops cyprinoides]
MMLTVQPSRGLVDEKLQVVVKNLPPMQKVTLHSLHQSESNDFWEALGHYVSDGKGTVTVAEDASVGGSYQGTEPMGLLWSMKPVPGSRTGIRLRKEDVRTPMVVQISVYRGHISHGFRETPSLACAVAERWYMAPGVRRVDVEEKGVRGTLFLPPGPGPFPGVLDLWGGEGGLVEYRSALLASHGYVSMALEYMTHIMGNSSGNNQLDHQYFNTAFAILRDHPQVCSDRVAMLGMSFGTTVALTMAVCSSLIEPRCLVCVSGSHVLPVEEPLSSFFTEMNKNRHKVRFDEEKRVISRYLLLPIPSDPSKKVNVGKIRCPLLLIVGEDDQNLPVSESAEDMEKMMKEAGNRHLLTTLSYPGAGHLIDPPYTPHFRSTTVSAKTREKVVVLWGGETKAHSYAQEHSWQRTLAFLQQHLYSSGHKSDRSNL